MDRLTAWQCSPDWSPSGGLGVVRDHFLWSQSCNGVLGLGVQACSQRQGGGGEEEEEGHVGYPTLPTLGPQFVHKVEQLASSL